MMPNISYFILQLYYLISFLIGNVEAFLPSKISQTRGKSGIFARKGAMSRRKEIGIGNSKSTSVENQKDAIIPAGNIYSLPALYDLAFGYRNYEDEVEFLIETHEKYSDFPATRILELAAGPGRHLIEALKKENSSVLHVTALDLSPDMVSYGKDLASHEFHDMSAFSYEQGDMRNFFFKTTFDSAWILLGSLQHMTTNHDVCSCFESTYAALRKGGTVILELPHPRETFSMGECTRNGWEVPLEDEKGNKCGELEIVWGDEDDVFDPISQIRNFTVSMELKNHVQKSNLHTPQSVREIVPLRQFTAQEIHSLATHSGFEVVAMFGALDSRVDVQDDEEAFRLVCILKK